MPLNGEKTRGKAVAICFKELSGLSYVRTGRNHEALNRDGLAFTRDSNRLECNWETSRKTSFGDRGVEIDGFVEAWSGSGEIKGWPIMVRAIIVFRVVSWNMLTTLSFSRKTSYYADRFSKLSWCWNTLFWVLQIFSCHPVEILLKAMKVLSKICVSLLSVRYWCVQVVGVSVADMCFVIERQVLRCSGGRCWCCRYSWCRNFSWC
jgi:hypothetical protein